MEVTAPVDLKLKPKNQNYTIVSLQVTSKNILIL